MFECRTSGDMPDREMGPDCMNSLDDDGDGKIDCADDDCAFMCSADKEEGTLCLDGLDNDGDKEMDCKDPDCGTSPLCKAGRPGQFHGAFQVRPTTDDPPDGLRIAEAGRPGQFHG